jgi:alginate O-acetyltransferase complex protein AlgI
MLYFVLHATATGAEGRLRIARWRPWAARLWTWAWLLIPLPLLFHQAFRDALVLPLVGGTR